jgi:deoxycytidine triphosphate deaminase
MEFWLPEVSDPVTKRLTIEKGKFYILRSKEHIRVPSGVAVYCRAVDETIGEMRINYAGFVHPGFGVNRSDGAPGTSLIFEVRGHDLNVSLKDSETMARLQFYRMSEDLEPEVSSYNEQSLKLSDFFKEWP